MSVSLAFEGLEALRAELRNLPAELASEASVIVQQAANDAEQQYAGGLAQKSGRLHDGVTLKTAATRAGTAAVVRSAARIAYIYDNGSKPRQTASGANRGSMPERPLNQRLVGIAIQSRRRMYAQLAALLQSHGAEVGE